MCTKNQWKRISRAHNKYDSLVEHSVEHASKTTRSRTLGTRSRDDRMSHLNDSKLSERKPILDSKIFEFANPERYKTNQLKEQAMALLVPGYL